MPRRRTAVLALAAAPLGLLAAGCGSGGPAYTNRLRPPEPVTISAMIDGGQVRVSPTSVGAGPLVVLISNQSAQARRVVLEPAGLGRGRRASTSVGANDTGRLQADARRGRYQLWVGGRGVSPASITVGPRRPSAQDQLLRP